MTLANQPEVLNKNVSGKCGENSSECQDGLSLAMWMKHDMLLDNRHSTSKPGEMGGKKYHNFPIRFGFMFIQRTFLLVVGL